MPIGLWILAFPVATTFCAGVCCYLSMWNRRYQRLTRMQHDALREAISVIDCLAARGAMVCDICHQPIAPKTPTRIEEYEKGLWTMAHDRCIA